MFGLNDIEYITRLSIDGAVVTGDDGAAVIDDKISLPFIIWDINIIQKLVK